MDAVAGYGQREDDWTTNTSGEAASCVCGYASIDLLTCVMTLISPPFSIHRSQE